MLWPIGFNGVLVSDDLSMGALSGQAGDLAVAALQAGCDVAMHCSGKLEDARHMLGMVPHLTPEAEARLAHAAGTAARSRLQLDRRALLADRQALSQAFPWAGLP